MQIAAANNTIAKNIYVPYLEGGAIKLVAANENPTFDPKEASQLCIVFNESSSQARDIETYIANAERRLKTI